MNTNEHQMWNRFVETGGLAQAGHKLEKLGFQVDVNTIEWAFNRTLTYFEPISQEMLVDAVAKRAASALKRQQKENFSLARELTGGICIGALA